MLTPGSYQAEFLLMYKNMLHLVSIIIQKHFFLPMKAARGKFTQKKKHILKHMLHLVSIIIQKPFLLLMKAVMGKFSPKKTHSAGKPR